MSQKSETDGEYNIKITITTLTKILVFGGLLLIAASSVQYGEYEKYIWVIACKKLLEIIGTTAFSAGLVSIVVEISTISGIVDKAFAKLLNCDFPIDLMSGENRKKIKKKIIAKEAGIPEDAIENSIYRYETDLLEQMSTIYYEYHNITYYITPDCNNQCFHISAKIDFKIVNKYEHDEDNKFRLSMKLFKETPSMTDEECLKNLNIKNLQINNKDAEPKECMRIAEIEHKSESKYYDYKIFLEKDLGSTKSNKIVAEYSYNVPMHDASQAFKIGRPCKNIEHKFYIKPDAGTGEKWRIRANAFSAFCHKQGSDDSNYKVEQDTDETLKISYKNWSVVGVGYVVFYQKAGGI